MFAILIPLGKRIFNRLPYVTIFLIYIIFNFSFPALAANKIDPQLESQVLEIIRRNPNVILESVQAYQEQEQQKLQQARQGFLQKVTDNAKLIIAQSPTTGATQSKILLVEFSDFQCPYCAKAHDNLKQFMAKHKDEVTLVYKHFPLIAIHDEALPSAKAAWGAQQQGKFWEFHDILFTNQKQLSEKLYMDTATKLGLDMEKFQRDRSAADKAIQDDMKLAESLGISGTPFFVMNGETFSGALKVSDIEAVLTRVKQGLPKEKP